MVLDTSLTRALVSHTGRPRLLLIAVLASALARVAGMQVARPAPAMINTQSAQASPHNLLTNLTSMKDTDPSLGMNLTLMKETSIDSRIRYVDDKNYAADWQQEYEVKSAPTPKPPGEGKPPKDPFRGPGLAAVALFSAGSVLTGLHFAA
eukprot:gnl/TRDRNA2_/TRDRNA2_182413_c0_seq1.p2 gnl/TRDRNA2_/TRDRNA2_182413_c0~~gnl/TRDRNA2_/TRDRNA2_182413_c0_seq1.p2  ORF type:complete len:162 (-),score=22.45 gnl/TRDRNA2_/TRDRNA2_182413_c0_seq1:116-565(-)